MAALLDLDWLFYVAGGLLGVAALWLLWRGLLADRSKGRARCPGCWYDLSGSGIGGVPVTCPECGRAIRRERHMHRTRRRWWVALSGIIAALLAAAALLSPRVRRDGGWSITPTWVMIALDATYGRAAWNSLDDALRERMFEPDMSRGMIARIVSTDRQLFYCRKSWPRGVPLWYRVGGKLPTGSACDIYLSDGAESAKLGGGVAGLFSPPIYSYEQVWNDGALSVPSFRPNARLLFALASVSRSGHRSMSQVEIPFPVSLVDRIDEVIQPVSGTEVDRLVCEGLRLRLTRLPTSQVVCLSSADPLDTALAGVTIGVRVQILDHGVLVAGTKWWQRTGATPSVGGNPIAIGGASGASGSLRGAWRRSELDYAISNADDPRYTVRIVGDGEMALRDFDGTKYWSGEFTMPLSELIRPAATTPAGGQTP